MPPLTTIFLTIALGKKSECPCEHSDQACIIKKILDKTVKLKQAIKFGLNHFVGGYSQRFSVPCPIAAVFSRVQALFSSTCGSCIRQTTRIAATNNRSVKTKGRRRSRLESQPAKYPKGEESAMVDAMIRAFRRARS